MSRNYRDDPNKVPLGDRRPWPSSGVSDNVGLGGSLLNPSYLSGGRDSPASGSGNGNNSFASIPSKFSQEFQSRWSSMTSEYGGMPVMPKMSQMSGFEPSGSMKRHQPGHLQAFCN